MQQHRILSLLSILVMIIIPVIGWFLIAQPQLDAAALADQNRTETETQIAVSSAIVQKLKEDSAKLPELNDDLNTLRTSIPAEVDSDGYIDGLDALAQVSGVVITGLTVDQPLVYTPAVPPVDPNAPVADAEAEPDGDAEGTAEDAPVAPAVDPSIVTSPLINSANFVAIPVTIELSGEWAPVLEFVDGLQTSPRLFLVTDLATEAVEGSRHSADGSDRRLHLRHPDRGRGQAAADQHGGEAARRLPHRLSSRPTARPDPDPTETPAP